MYKAIIFDCDGTIIDASIMITLLYEGYKNYYPQRPSKPYEDFICCYYFTNIQTQKYLEISDDEYEDFICFCFGEDDHIMKTTRPFTNVCTVIKQLYEKGYQLGINTSRIKDHLEPLKEQLGMDIYSMFQCIVTSEDVKKPKPDPESLFKIARQMNIEMDEMLYIGDSENDSVCAYNAGCNFALAMWGLVDDHMPKANFYLHAVEDIHNII